MRPPFFRVPGRPFGGNSRQKGGRGPCGYGPSTQGGTPLASSLRLPWADMELGLQPVRNISWCELERTRREPMDRNAKKRTGVMFHQDRSCRRTVAASPRRPTLDYLSINETKASGVGRRNVLLSFAEPHSAVEILPPSHLPHPSQTPMAASSRSTRICRTRFERSFPHCWCKR